MQWAICVRQTSQRALNEGCGVCTFSTISCHVACVCVGEVGGKGGSEGEGCKETAGR